MIRLLIVEDSVTQREILRRLFGNDPEFQIVAEASTGHEAIEQTLKHVPDVVLMDIHMPGLDGISATREIMEQCPVPIVVASATLRRDEIDLAMKALEAGAVAVVEKPQGAVLLHLQSMVPALRQELILASQAQLRPTFKRRKTETPPPHIASPARTSKPGKSMLAIGLVASTGGPPVLRTILSALPRGFPLPILLVQHISRGFEEGFANWLTSVTGHSTMLAAEGQRLTPGIWMSPQGHHLMLGEGGRIMLPAGQPTDLHCPSGNALFRSLSERLGDRCTGVLLTGMGDDGASGLLELKEAGGTTIIQSEESCLIWGMPRAAREKAAALHELSPIEIARMLNSMAQSIMA